MLLNSVILTASRCRGKFNYLIKSVNYHLITSNNQEKTSVLVTSKRQLYSDKQNNTLNKWYTTTGELKPGEPAVAKDVTEKEYYDMICELKEEQRNALNRALSMWKSEKVKGQLEGGRLYEYF